MARSTGSVVSSSFLPALPTGVAVVLAVALCSASCSTATTSDPEGLVRGARSTSSAVDPDARTAGCARVLHPVEAPVAERPLQPAGPSDRVVVQLGSTPPAAHAADGHPLRAAWARFPGGYAYALGAVAAAAVAYDGVAFVEPTGVLSRVDVSGCVQRLDEGPVLPELAVSPSGARIAYPVARAGVSRVLVSRLDAEGSPRAVASELADCDRPLFVGEETLVVVGSRARGVAGVHLVRLDGDAVRTLTNARLRVGTPFDASFVPPPARHASMRIEQGELRYDDGVGEQHVSLGPSR